MNLPINIRNKIAALIREMLAERQGVVSTAAIPVRLRQNEIEWMNYAESNKFRPWLEKNFPEFECDGNNLTLRHNVPADVMAKIDRAVTELLIADGKLSLAKLGAALNKLEINRKAYPGGNVFPTWIIDLFPHLHFRPDEQNNFLFSDAPIREPIAEYPAIAAALPENPEGLIRQMDALAYMGNWSNNVRFLCHYTGCSGTDQKIWSGMIAWKLSEVLLGRAPVYTTGEGDALRVAFPCGFDTPAEQPMFCVLKPYHMQEQQPLVLEYFCHPHEPNGKWLKELLDKNAKPEKPTILQLETYCTQLEGLQEALIPKVEEYLNAVRNGARLPFSLEAESRDYTETWARIRTLRSEIGAPEELTSAQEILAWCREQNHFSAYFLRIEQLVATMQELLGATVNREEDLAALRHAFEVFGDAPSTDGLREILAPYYLALKIMDETQITAETTTNIIEISTHFGVSGMLFFGLCTINKEKHGAYHAAVEELENQLEALFALVAPAEPETARCIPAPADLLSAICEDRLEVLFAAAGSEDRLETLVLEDRLQEAKEHAADAVLMTKAGYTEEERQQIAAQLSADLPTGTAVRAVAERLSAVFGNERAVTERYYLMGLCADHDFCTDRLLEQYRTTDQREKFALLWAHFEDAAVYNPENHLYYLSVLAPDQHKAYLDRHVYLYYLPAYAEAVAAHCGRPLAACNKLEQALIADDTEAVRTLLNDRPALQEMGYTDDDVAQLSLAAISEACPTGTDAHKVGMRLYLYQSNRNGLAEQYLWQGLAEAPTAENGDQLICILSAEQRWEECIRLYNCFATNANIGNECRKAYLLAMLCTEPIKVQQPIRNDLRNFLSIAYYDPVATEAVERYRLSEEPFGEFYRQIHGLLAHLASDYPRSVILHNRGLREMLNQPGLLAEQGLDDKLIEQAQALYQSGSYPTGNDALSVAKRLYALEGNRFGAAECFAAFSLPAEEAARLLWNIYSAAGQTEELHQLLKDHPCLQTLHPEEYGRYLFETGRYEAFLVWLQQQEDPSPLMLRQAVAKLHIDPTAAVEFPILETPVSAADSDCLLLLAVALAKQERLDDLETVLMLNFDRLLHDCPAERVNRILTADGLLSAATLLTLQENALQAERLPFAIYLYNVLEVGALAEEAEAYFIAQSENVGDPMQELERIDRLARLYPARSAQLRDRTLLLQVRELTETENPVKDAPRRLAELLDHCVPESEVLPQVLYNIQNSPHAGSAPVLRSVATLTEHPDLQLIGLHYLHQLAMRIKSNSEIPGEELYRPLCRRYLDTLNTGSFPEELAADAESLCRQIFMSDKAECQAVFCLYRLENKLGQSHKAAFTLRYLAALPAAVLGDRLFAVVSVDADTAFGDKLPTVPELFRDAAQNSTPEELLNYCRFCKTFNEGKDTLPEQVKEIAARFAEADTDAEYLPYGESDCETLINALFAALNDEARWFDCARIPELSAEARGKLLYLSACSNATKWRRCIDYCIRNGLDALLLKSICRWVTNAKNDPKDRRNILQSLLHHNPTLFDAWTAEEDLAVLLEIVGLLCRELAEEVRIMPAQVAHAALGTVTSIAVAIHTDQAVKLLQQDLYGFLINEYNEVGITTTLRLLLAGRTALAAEWLADLMRSNAPITCRSLVDLLGGLSPAQLSEWAAAEENRRVMEFLLPDGNRPNAESIQRFSLDCIKEGKAQEGTAVLDRLLDIFPGDYACSDSLFILCKSAPEIPVPLLHKCLCRLVSNSRGTAMYYRRDHLRNACLLAGVNAVVRAKGLENLCGSYDFNQAAGTYCLGKQPLTSGENVRTINGREDDFNAELANLQADELEFHCRRILSWVTADWTKFLLEAWQKGISSAELQEALSTGTHDSVADSLGFCRSLLRALRELNLADTEDFMNWVLLALDPKSDAPSQPWTLQGKLRHFYMAENLNDNRVAQKAGAELLDYPIEEYSHFSLLYEELVTPLLGTDPELLYYRLWLIGAVADYHVILKHQYSNGAHSALRRKDNATAAAFYEALLRLLRYGLYHTDTMTEIQYRTFQATYEANARVWRLFAGDADILDKVSAPTFHPWSCLNMMMTVLCSEQADQSMRLANTFKDDNGTMSRVLIATVNPEIPDEDKIAMLHAFPNGVAKLYLAYVMSRGKGPMDNFTPFFFRSAQYSKDARETAQSLYRMLDKPYFCETKAGGFYPEKTLICTFNQINPKAYADADFTTPAVPLPEFVADLTPPDQPEDVAALQETLRSLPDFPRYYEERLACAEKLYRATLPAHISLDENSEENAEEPATVGIENNEEETLPALIEFGLAYCKYHLDSDDPEKINAGKKAVLELVSYVDSRKKDPRLMKKLRITASVSALESAVENNFLHLLLMKNINTVQELLNHYTPNQRAYRLIRGMVRLDSFRNSSAFTIFRMLDILAQRYVQYANNPIQWREALSKAKNALYSINYNGWADLKQHLDKLLQNAISAMDARPILSIKILNPAEGPAEDFLYGEIYNDGRQPAENVYVQAFYENNSSERQVLSVLEPGDHNSFRIPYDAGSSETLHYTVNCNYSFNGGSDQLAAIQGTLTITEEESPSFPTGHYLTSTITNFYEDENGNITSPHFFGRESETEDLRNLFRGGYFPEYRNAIVYGIRRAGKTSLLNYVLSYVDHRHKDAIVVKVDCTKRSGHLIQYFFIDLVLLGLEGREVYKALTETEAWENLKKRWTLPAESTQDRPVNELKKFYRELKETTGKGLILLMDEVDNFFTSVELQSSLDSELFQELSNELCHPDFQAVVHLILCGSKYLLRYRDAGAINQFFQRLGDNVIEVGLLTESETKKMLTAPYADYPEVRFTEEALDVLWEYTHGLIWPVKLLGNQVMSFAKENKRSIIYPFDVRKRIRYILDNTNCEQFFDGIQDEKDKRERLVVDAMQSLASNKNTRITLEELERLLVAEASTEIRMTEAQLTDALTTLEKLQLIRHQEGKGYYFTIDIYRRYFRRQKKFTRYFKAVCDTEPTFIPAE